MNRDKVIGTAKVVKGRFKQAAADLANDPNLHDEGVSDEVAGTMQDAIGRARAKLGKVVEHVGKAIKK